jgi:CRP-like cAMP-binding protein
MINTVGLRTGLVIVGVVVSAVVVVSLGGLRRIDKVALAPEGLSAVQGVPMLAVLPEHTMERLARTSTVVDVPGGSTVFRAGEIGDRFYIVERGTADVLVDGTIVASVGEGDSFGEIALLRDVPRTATVLATENLRLRAIDRRHFLPAVTGHAEASEQAELVVGRLMDGS